MEPIRIYDEENHLLLRDGFNIAFFVNKPFQLVSQQMAQLFDAWLNELPPDLEKYASIGANSGSYRAFNKNTINRCYAILDPEEAKAREISYFRIHAGAQLNPPYAFMVLGKNEFEEPDKECSTVQMCFPGDFPNTRGIDALLELCIKISDLFPYDTGYASMALNYCTTYKEEASEFMFPLAMRYPGFDIYTDMSIYNLGTKSRGARWLTFLSKSNIQILGGIDELKNKVLADIKIITTDNGVAMVAGDSPTTGDVNKKEILPLVRSVAAAIEPVTFFGDYLCMNNFFFCEEDNVDSWERRFFD